MSNNDPNYKHPNQHILDDLFEKLPRYCKHCDCHKDLHAKYEKALAFIRKTAATNSFNGQMCKIIIGASRVLLEELRDE